MDTNKLRCTKTSKAKPILKRRSLLLQKITSGFFRLLEKIVVLVFVLKLIFKISMALESSFERYKGSVTVIGCRHYVFVVGNVIIVALLIKSGRLSSREESNSKASTDCLYEEFLAKAERGRGIARPEVENRDEQSTAAMKQKQDRCEILAEQGLSETKQSRRKNKKEQSSPEHKRNPNPTGIRDELQSTAAMKQKQDRCENLAEQGPSENRAKQSATESRPKESGRKNQEEERSPERMIYRRTHSEKLLTSCDDSYGKLRRSQTNKSAETVKSDERKQRYPEDDMSENEFLSKIEAFIARQRRFQLDEECCSQKYTL